MRASIGDRRHVRSDGHHKVRLSRDEAKRLAAAINAAEGANVTFYKCPVPGCRWHIGTRRAA